MIGVILWSDPQERKAVIWCEDNGDLAFYHERSGTRCDSARFGAGDMVRFDVESGGQYRYAHNPEIVAEGTHPGLPDALRPPSRAAQARAASPSATIIPFQQRKRRAMRAQETSAVSG